MGVVDWLVHRMDLVLTLCLAVGVTLAQDGPIPSCPEKNGFFPDPDQCDKYYECVGDVPEEKYCPDGLLFDSTDPNSELCDYPFNVDCGSRAYVQEPEPGLDPKCYRANGFFNHEDPTVCTKYYNCVHGYPHAYDCPAPLVFDEAQGTCVREEQAYPSLGSARSQKRSRALKGSNVLTERRWGLTGSPSPTPPSLTHLPAEST